MPCFRKFLVAKKFLDKKWGVSILFVEKFCLSAEKICRETLYCVLNIGYRKSLWIRRGSIKICRQNIFVSVPKKFVGEPFSLSLIWDIEKVYASEGFVTIFRRTFFVS